MLRELKPPHRKIALEISAAVTRPVLAHILQYVSRFEEAEGAFDEALRLAYREFPSASR